MNDADDPGDDDEVELDVVADLTTALADLQPSDKSSRAKLQAAVDALMKKIPGDLTKISEEKFMAVDTGAQSRRLYVGALLRLWQFLAMEAPDFEGQKEQARISLALVKHVEGSKTLAVTLGKTSGDKKLTEETEKLRRELREVFEAKKQLQAAKVVDAEIIPT